MNLDQMTSGGGAGGQAMRQHLPKYALLLGYLRERVLGTPRGEPVGTVLGFRTEFGVSQATVDRALGELRKEGLIESRRGSGIFATGRRASRNVGIFFGYDVFAPRSGEFPLLMLKALRALAGERNCVLRYYLPSDDVAPLEDRISALSDDIRHHLVDGIIFEAFYSDVPGQVPVPAVGLGPLPNVAGRVLIDSTAVVRLGTRALLDQGCRRVALLLGGMPDTLDASRAAFRETLENAGVPFRPEWIAPLGGSSAQESTDSGYRGFNSIWQAGAEKPDGVVSGDDYGTVGLLQAMREKHVAPGSSVKIASHANVGVDLFGGVPVTRVEYDPAVIARTLLDTLDDMINGRQERPVAKVLPKLGLSAERDAR